MRFILILLGIAVSSAIVTFLLHTIKVCWIKYIPSLLSLLFAVLMIILAQGGTAEGMQDLAWIVVSILFFAGALGGGITAIVLDWFLKRSK